MKIYFAGSIRGGRILVDTYKRTVEFLKSEGHQVLTEYVADPTISSDGEKKSESYMFEKDFKLLKEANLILADISITSVGVGWEIGYSQAIGKKIICLYNVNSEKK